MEVIIAPKARGDIASILAWTKENFGPQTFKRYEKLIQTAIQEVAANPELAGSRQRPAIAEHCRTYHLFHSRKKAGGRGKIIPNPPAVPLYRGTESRVGESGAVLHESIE